MRRKKAHAGRRVTPEFKRSVYEIAPDLLGALVNLLEATEAKCGHLRAWRDAEQTIAPLYSYVTGRVGK